MLNKKSLINLVLAKQNEYNIETLVRTEAVKLLFLFTFTKTEKLHIIPVLRTEDEITTHMLGHKFSCVGHSNTFANLIHHQDAYKMYTRVNSSKKINYCCFVSGIPLY